MRVQKKTKWTALWVIVIFSMGMAGTPGESRAAEGKYPSRPIQVVFGWEPGSGDLAYRPFMEKMQEYLGQPMTFLYKPGAAGAVGASYAAHSVPDGYTIIAYPPIALVVPPIVQGGLDYTMDDFVPICRLVQSPIMLAVKADSPLRTLKEVVEQSRKSPGKLTYSTTGVNSGMHFAMELFATSARIRLTHVPGTGSAPSVMAAMGGHVDMTCSSMGGLSPHIKSGGLRPLVVFQKERLKSFPDVPTASEFGYPVVLTSGYGFLAPKRVPQEVVKTIYGAAKKAMDVHGKFIESRIEKLSLEMHFRSPEEAEKENQADRAVFEKLLKEKKKTTKK